MNIVTKIGRGKVDHAARYKPETGGIVLYCDSLRFPDYFAAVTDYTEPDENNVTCKKCLSILKGGK